MRRIDLAGNWNLSQDGKPPIPGHLPGSTYLDYMANGMPDPFWGMNETAASELANHNYTYSRNFELTSDFIKNAHVDLVAQGFDTLCTIMINGNELGRTNNINRQWRMNAKWLLKPGDNIIEIKIENPFPYMARRHKKEPLPSTRGKAKGRAHLRKTPCHFGWDWGPFLSPAGIIGTIALESLETRIEDMRIRQRHRNDENGKKLVELEITAQLSSVGNSIFEGELKLTTPSGETIIYKTDVSGHQLYCFIKLDNPQIWWCNGLGESPLYKVEMIVKRSGEIVDAQEKQIGLRTIELDTSNDKYGAMFRFILNGVPIFAKGANWIPADSFITRVQREDINFYVECARQANMNMLRVWGGGMYGCEDFYDACDKNGILVWQDFIFACSAYPLYDETFLENVHGEVADNVRRIRHRASLALWCGNNENEFLVKLFIKDSKIGKSNLSFYHDILRTWVNEIDGATPYWPGSPSAGDPRYKHSTKMGQIRGDSHLWQVWYGMMPMSAIRKLPTRFCSEYGMESMPSMHTIRSFTNELFPSLFDPVISLHQKSVGGSERMLYYLLANYRNPAKFEDLVYLSQLVQANMVHYATDFWRRGMGLYNGSLFWQFNDCWPVASWAAIDYHKQLKAITYQSRHFNKPLCLSNDHHKDRAEIYIINELPQDFSGILDWSLCDFHGNKINNGMIKVFAPAISSTKSVVLNYKSILNGRAKEEAALIVRFLTLDDQVLDEKSWLMVPDKDARLPGASVIFEDVQIEETEKGKFATVTVRSKVYARYVFLEVKGITSPWSDNFFDIPPGSSRTVTVQLTEDIDLATLLHRLKAKSLSDVKPKNSKFKDKWIRFSMLFKKGNWASWFVYKFM
jgi:beta-mannosidase